MKICHITDYLPNYHKIWGGAEQGCYRIIQLLSKNSFEICVMGTKPLKKINEIFQFYEIPTWERYFNIKFLWRYEKVKDLCLPFDSQAFFSTFHLLKKIGPDVLHLHRINFISFAPVLCAKLLNIPVVLSLYDYWSICPNLLLVNSENVICRKYQGVRCFYCIKRGGSKQIDDGLVVLRKIGFDFFLKKIDIFHVLSNSSKNLLRNYGITEERVKVIPLPSPISPGEVTNTDAEAGLTLFVGWVEPRKGLDIVVKAIDEVRHSCPQVKLVVLGGITDVNYSSGIDFYIKQHKLERNIEFKGKISFKQVNEYLKKAEIVVIAEQWENMSPVILTEAMALAKPIVAGEIGGIPEFIDDGKNGLLAQYNSSKDFADKIVWFLKNKQQAKEIGQKAREKILSMSSESNLASQFREMYDELVH